MGRDINILSPLRLLSLAPRTCRFFLDLEKLDICISPFCLGPPSPSYISLKKNHFIYILTYKVKPRLEELYRVDNFFDFGWHFRFLSSFFIFVKLFELCSLSTAAWVVLAAVLISIVHKRLEICNSIRSKCGFASSARDLCAKLLSLAEA